MDKDNTKHQYGYLTTVYWNGCVTVSRILLGHNVNYNWSTSLVNKYAGTYTCETDQTVDLEANHVYSLDNVKELHFNGCVIYKDWKFWRRWVNE